MNKEAVTKGDNLSLFRKFAYSGGNLGTTIIGELAAMWIIFFYTPLAPVLFIGGVVFFGRIVDAIADPLVGYFSDKTKTRFGRRIPFIAVGTPFLITALILIFHPPVATESVTNAIYLAVMMSFLWIFFTVVVAPYLALLPDWEKRTADYEALSDADVRRVISEFVPLTYRQVRDLLRRAG